MVQLLDGTGDVPEFASPVSLLQPWLALVSADVQEAELMALQYVVGAVYAEFTAFHSAQHALMWIQHGSAELMTSWFTSMLRALRDASWHWGVAVDWLHKFGDEQRAAFYQPFYEQVAAHQLRLTGVTERYQGYIIRYCQEWGLALPEVSEQAGQ